MTMLYRDYVIVYLALFFTAFISTASRTYVRKKINKSFHAEDWLAVIACTIFFVQTVLDILFTKAYTIAINIPELLVTVPSTDIPHYIKNMLEIQVGSHLGFLTALWMIKFSFLFFYRRLAQGMPTSKLWIFTFIFTALFYVGNVIGFFFVCVPLTTYWNTTCSAETNRSNAALYAGTATDIFSDLLIMILPIRLLGYLRMSILQKIGLSGLFCLGTTVIIMSVARTVRTNSGKNGALPESDPRWVAVWSAAEETTAILVCCLPAIRKLFTTHRERDGHVHTPWGWRPMSFRSFPRWSIRATRKTSDESASTGHGSIQMEVNTNRTKADKSSFLAIRCPNSATVETARKSGADTTTSGSSSQEELYFNQPASPASTVDLAHPQMEANIV